jgi:HPt (histidine-containing phosphotransfer) domain-containing protein
VSEADGSMEVAQIVNWDVYCQARTALGAAFARILGYFREDGIKSVAQIEDAMRAKDSFGLILPAHTLKGSSYQFGAEQLGDLAEKIEMTARRCVEHHDEPDELLAEVVRLRPLFEETLVLLEREASPLVERKPGRRPGFHQSFA